MRGLLRAAKWREGGGEKTLHHKRSLTYKPVLQKLRQKMDMNTDGSRDETLCIGGPVRRSPHTPLQGEGGTALKPRMH